MKKFLIRALISTVLLSLFSAAGESMYRGGPSRQGVYKTAVPAKISGIKWNVKIGRGIMSSPVIDENIIYIGCDDCFFYAIDKNNGAVLWKFNARQIVRSSALVTSDTVYFSDFKNYLYALDKKNGELKWEKNLYEHSKTVMDPVKNGYDDYLPSPVIYKNLIITCSFDPVHPLFAFDEKTGKEKWVLKLKSGDIFFSSPAVFGDMVYIGGMTEGILAVNALKGTVVWDYKMDNYPVRYSAAIGNDGTVYFGTKNRDFIAFDGKTGELMWRMPVSRDTWLIGNPVIAGDTVFIGSSKDKKLFALDAANGETRWAFEADGWVYSSCIYAQGTVYAGSHDKNLYAIDAKSGKEIWKYSFDDIIYSSPLVENGIIYVAVNDGNIFALN